MWVGLRRVIAWLIRIGGSPKHVAFIMDGNRRFADKKEIDEIGGHTEGYRKMVDAIHWCVELGVRHISVYAFSIDNFKRSANEVGSLMHLAEEKYMELAKENGLAEREGVEMRIVGDLSFCPSGVQGAAARLMQGTASLKHCHAVLNICFSYTSTEELLSALSELQQGLETGTLSSSDITPQLLRQSLRTRQDSPPVDLLIRTSGETRLSDFMLWQVSDAYLSFIDVLWPDLTFCDVARCVLQYQASCLQKLGVTTGTTPSTPLPKTTDVPHKSPAAVAGETESSVIAASQATAPDHQSQAAATGVTEMSEIDAACSPCCVSEDEQFENGTSMPASAFPASMLSRVISNTSTSCESDISCGAAFEDQVGGSQGGSSCVPDDTASASMCYTSSTAASTASAVTPSPTPHASPRGHSTSRAGLQNQLSVLKPEHHLPASYHAGMSKGISLHKWMQMGVVGSFLHFPYFICAMILWLLQLCVVAPVLFLVRCSIPVFHPQLIASFLSPHVTAGSRDACIGLEVCQCQASKRSRRGGQNPEKVGMLSGEGGDEFVRHGSDHLMPGLVSPCSCQEGFQTQRQRVHHFFKKIDGEHSGWINTHVGL